jgi:dolichol-phosphate mannosyltransferase
VTRRDSNAELAASAPVVVVIPTYNERENIEQTVRDVLALGDRYSLLIVDDNSPDGTADIVRGLQREFSDRLELLSRSSKDGIGRAYIAGFQRILERGPEQTPLIAQMDADHSHLPADLARMVTEAEHADLVLASRYVSGGETVGWPWHRKLISRMGGIYSGLILGVPIRDLTGGFKVWRRHVLERIELSSIHSDGYSFQIETTYRAIRQGVRYTQVPITFVDRVAGKSKLSRRVVIEAIFIPWNLRLRHLFRRAW